MFWPANNTNQYFMAELHSPQWCEYFSSDILLLRYHKPFKEVKRESNLKLKQTKCMTGSSGIVALPAFVHVDLYFDSTYKTSDKRGTRGESRKEKNVCSGDRCAQTAILSWHDRSTHKLFVILGLQMSLVRADTEHNPVDDTMELWPEVLISECLKPLTKLAELQKKGKKMCANCISLPQETK